MFALSTLTLLSLALMTGNEFCVAAFVEPALRALPEEQQVPAVPGFAARLGKVMPFWYAFTLLLTAWLAFSRYRHGVALWNGATIALLLQLLVLTVTLTMLVPRNTRLAQMTSAYPSWLRDARQWDTLHQIRVALLLAACLAIAIF